jgi:cyclophilin family peptidyl-prolyl cis-trans isomerase
VSPTASRQSKEREAARRRAQELALAEAHRRAARRRGLIGIGVVVGVILAVIVVVRGAADQKERKAASSSTAAPTSTGPGPARPAAALPTVAPGATIAGQPPCPAGDGSAPRTTQFGGPPPDCLDPGLDYVADLMTSKGRIVVDLQKQDYPGPVNNFVFLARYHYYDGLPVTFIRRGGWAEVADPVNADGSPGPGYRQPATGQREASLYASLFVGLTARGGTTGGGLTLGMPGQEAANIAPDTSPLGLIRDARTGGADSQMTVQILINNASAASGAPAEVITLDRVDIRTCPLGANCPDPPLPG